LLYHGDANGSSFIEVNGFVFYFAELSITNAQCVTVCSIIIIIITNEEIKVTLSRKRCRGTLQDYDYSTLYLLSPISMVWSQMQFRRIESLFTGS